MATFTFLQRNSVFETPTTLSLLIVNGRKFKLTVATPYSIEPAYWVQTEQMAKFTKRVTGVADKIKKTEIENLNNNLVKFKTDFKIFFNNNPNVTREEIKEYFKATYFTSKSTGKNKKEENRRPQKLVDFIELYIKEKSETLNGEQTPISAGTIKSYRRVKNHIIRINKDTLISEVDNEFRRTYARFCEQNEYDLSYQTKQLGYIKTFCKYAFEQMGYDNISNEVLRWSFAAAKEKIRNNSILHPIFTTDEVVKLKNCVLPHEHLDNARDWLIISIFTAQRVSDFLRFDSGQITDDNLLELIQKKTANHNTIFLLPDVLDILKKRNGAFPRRISDQNYNKYIKKVCKIAGLTEIIEGKKKTEVIVNGKNVQRSVRGFYPKYELVTSHIGRRSFVSIGVQQGLTDATIMAQTGHKNNQMIKTYNQTSQKEKARLNGAQLSKLKIT